MAKAPLTKFAPSERASSATINRQAQTILDLELIGKLYDAVNDIVIVVNAQRQIVFANRNLTKLLNVVSPEELWGLRPGEALRCGHSREMSGGCGTGEHCQACGAVMAVLASLEGRSEQRECRVLRETPAEALDLLIRTTPLNIEGERFVICAINDISDHKRRRALERLFFHDVLNTIWSIRSMTEMLDRSDADRLPQVRQGLRDGVRRLVEEIASQKDLTAAENAELAVMPQSISARAFLEDVLEMYRRSPEGREHTLCLDGSDGDVRLKTDPILLGRVLGNLVKNALEASPSGQNITAGVEATDGVVRFHVHNIGAIPHDVQLQLFQRSFSTKGAERGLGTYSARLLTERYLNGRVHFISDEKNGTIFSVELPREI